MFMFPLLDLVRRIAESTPFLPSFIHPLEISSFWRTSIFITPSGTQQVLPIPIEKNYSIGSSFLTSFLLRILTYLIFSVAPLAVAFALSSPLVSPLSPSLTPWRCFRTWVLITYQFYSLFLFLWSSFPKNVPRPSIFRKLLGMTHSFTLALTVLLQMNTCLFLFSLLLLLSLLL